MAGKLLGAVAKLVKGSSGEENKLAALFHSTILLGRPIS
ncbi:unnamed protein product [Brassica rapa subsp. narinosa]